MESARPLDRIGEIRRFNRFYTRQIGLVNGGLIKSPYSLTEARVLYDLAHRDRATATEAAAELGLDAGYLSRILHRFERLHLIEKHPSEHDGRQNILTLTDEGRAAFRSLDEMAQREIGQMIDPLNPVEQGRLVQAMGTIQAVLSPRRERPAPFVLRAHRPGDIGWITHRQGVLYWEEYRWDERFEALAAKIAASFIENFDPEKERCWVAEQDGEIVGSVFLVRQSDEVAKLRLLYVEPRARGRGLGRHLVQECIRFAREKRYRKLVLWTNAVLVAARRIYEIAGFSLVDQQSGDAFGHPQVFQTWELSL